MRLDAALLTADIAQSGAMAKAFEAQGFDGVLSFEGPHDPFLPLALAARETERVELITGIAIAFARNPMICAQLANDLQLLSEGRFILGLGTQIRPHIERRFSQPWSKPNRRMREFVQAIRAIWRSWNDGERLEFRGEFYTHTLMTPFFNPGPNPFGVPKIFLAGFGPDMIRVAGEVGDGWIVHPLHSRDYVLSTALPALEVGLAKAGRSKSGVQVACQTITMVGHNDEEIAKARNNAKAQIAFYASTPAYRVVLDHHGWGGLQPELNRLSKEGKWLDMIGFVSEEMLDAFGVSGTPSRVAAALRKRNDFADRTTMVLYNEAGPDAVTDILRAVKAAPA
jgi:probable F420-dependent oxidoreductase